MADKKYSQDIQALQTSLSYFGVAEDKLTQSALKILGKTYSIYAGYCQKLLFHSVDPRIIDVYTFARFVDVSEINTLIKKLTDLDNPDEYQEPKEQEASIPPELESLVAEYRLNQALLEEAEVKSNSRRSVAIQVKIAIAHSQIRNIALANRQAREQRGEKFDKIDALLISLGSPKSVSKEEALKSSYNIVREVALSYPGYSKLSPQLQKEILDSVVELQLIGVQDINTAIQTSAFQVDRETLSDSDKAALATIPGGFISTVYQEVNSQNQKAVEYESTVSDNELRIHEIEKELATKSDEEKASRAVEIKSLIAQNEQLLKTIEAQSQELNKIIEKQTDSFNQFESERKERQLKGPDGQDKIEIAYNEIASIQNKLEAHGVKAHIASPLDESSELEKAIRHDLPGMLLSHSGYRAEYVAALTGNSKTQNPILSPQAVLLYGKELNAKNFAEVRLFIKNNPDSLLGKLYLRRKDLFDTAGSQIRKIAKSPLGKDLIQATSRIGKFFKPVSKVFRIISDKVPGGLGNLFRIAQDPIGAFRSWVGKKIGNYVIKKVLSSAAGKAAIEAGKKLAGELLKKGIGKAIVSLAAKVGLKLGLAATGVGAIPALVWFALDIIAAAFKAIKNAVQKVAVALYGEELKARDVIAVPAAAVGAAFGSVIGFFAAIWSASTAAAGSAIITIVVSTLAIYFVYITTFVTAPLISTLVQLESTSSASLKDCNNTSLTNDKKVCNGDYCFPVNDTALVSYATYHHDYPANDILKIGDTPGPEDDVPLPLLAYTSGTVTWTSEGDNLGGLALIIAGNDGRFYYYAHNMCNLVSVGQSVTAGEVVAGMDSSGNASSYLEHVHFQISDQADMTTIPENYPHFLPPWEDFCSKLSLCGNLNPTQNPELPYL